MGLNVMYTPLAREILQRCANLEQAGAVVFERRLFSTKDCMRPCTESMKWHADDGHIIIYIIY